MVFGDHIHMMWSQFIITDVFNILYKNLLVNSHVTLMYQNYNFYNFMDFFFSFPSLCYKLHKYNVQYVKSNITLFLLVDF